MKRPFAPPSAARVALIAPAGPLPEGAIGRALDRVRRLGWVPVLGRHSGGRSGYLAGTDAERLEDLRWALESGENDLIWCLRGGYGTMRILPEIDLRPLLERPRPLIGFSDNTALHLHAFNNGIVSFHGPHAAAAELSDFSLDCLLRTLDPTAAPGLLPASPFGAPVPETVFPGLVEGPLVGGNLALLAATVGTPFELRAEGAILFLEEVGEPAYRVDRMLTQLRQAGLLDGVAGVAVGAFSESPDTEPERLPTVPELLLDRLGDLKVPVASGLPFGHIAESWTLPLGARARLDASACTLEILEPVTVR